MLSENLLNAPINRLFNTSTFPIFVLMIQNQQKIQISLFLTFLPLHMIDDLNN